MTPAEIAAYIGAAAWAPQIAAWLYKWLSRPALTVLPERSAELGFTSYGPIFNVRVAFSAQRKDVVIEDFQVDVVHQDGDRRVFRWSGIQEDLGESRDAAGVRQGKLMKDQIPIAIKVPTAGLVEKLVMFQEPRFDDTVRPLMQNLVAQFNHLKRTDPNGFVGRVLNSKELFDLVDAREKLFWWKPGRYEVVFKPIASQRLVVVRGKYSFALTALDIDRLRQNVQSLKADLENTVKSNLADFEAVPVTWNWAYGKLSEVK